MSPRRLTLSALITAGLLWGTTVPLTKLALTGIGPAWLTVLRFAVAALPLAVAAGGRLRAAASPGTIGWGAAGYGVVILLQNAGIERTSVSHSALIVGATPVLAAVLGHLTGRGRLGAPTWAGLAVSLLGIAAVAAGGGGAATPAGDALVGASAVLSAVFLLVQPRLLAGRSVVAVTAVQFGAGAVVAVPFALTGGAATAAAPSTPAVLAVVLLAVAGTLIPFTLFAYGQKRTSPAAAGTFVNLEPIVGFGLGIAVFGDAFTGSQVVGAVVALSGIALTAVSLARPDTPRPVGGLLRG